MHVQFQAGPRNTVDIMEVMPINNKKEVNWRLIKIDENNNYKHLDGNYSFPNTIIKAAINWRKNAQPGEFVIKNINFANMTALDPAT